MAIMIPDIMQEDNHSVGEREVFECLKTKLGSDYYVFHSVRWNDVYSKKRTIWGESDFTVFHPRKGILTIEVKSGGVEYKNNKWSYVRTDNGERHDMKNPLKQADNCKYRFIDILKEDVFEKNNIEGFYCQIEPAVWFPDVEKRDSIGELPFDYHEEIVLLQEALDDPETYLENVFRFYKMKKLTRLDKTCEELIVREFAPHYEAKVSLKAKRKEHELTFMRFTEEQNGLIHYLCEQKVAAIQGAAGTGKTMLAKEKAKDLAKDGKVLFLCVNTFLCDELRDEKSTNKKEYENVEFYTIRNLICKLLMVPRVSDAEIVSVLDNYDQYDWDFKHIVIDEAQDLKNDYLVKLKDISILTEGAFYVFYDKNQAVQNDLPDWLKNEVECRLVLNVNCRNTFRIASASGKPIGVEPKTLKLVKGDKPEFYLCKDKREIEKALNKLVLKYVKAGYALDEICIITLKTMDTSILKGIKRICSYDVTEKRTKNKILFTTARKFKGLESDAIIIVDIDKDTFLNTQEEMGDEESTIFDTKMLFYVGASRAKYNLDMIILGDENALADINQQLGFTVGKKPSLVCFAKAMDAEPGVLR